MKRLWSHLEITIKMRENARLCMYVYVCSFNLAMWLRDMANESGGY